MSRYFTQVLIGIVLGWFLHTTAAPPVDSGMVPASSGLVPEESDQQATEDLQDLNR